MSMALLSKDVLLEERLRKTPIGVAKEEGHHEIVEILKKIIFDHIEVFLINTKNRND